jgi:glutamate-5-semialdehyde dehydrogenase
MTQPDFAGATAPVDPQVTAGVRSIAQRSRTASRELALASRTTKDEALGAMADELLEVSDAIVQENSIDLQVGEENGMATGLLDRLRLTPQRIVDITDALRELAALPDPVGELVRGSTLSNGLKIRQVRVPMGVVGMIYEARPNVTVDAAGLGLKSGNAVILRGGHAAERTNAVIVEALRRGVVNAGLPADVVQTIDPFGREGVRALMRARGLVDLLVPRGGAGLIQTVVTESRVPVIETGVGNCHVYVDKAADLDKALAIAINSKVHRPSVCNAAETLLVDKAIADTFLPMVADALTVQGVTLHVDDAAAARLPAGIDAEPATDDDWGREYLDLEMAVGVVDGVDGAIAHIQTWSSGHTESICTEDIAAATRFTDRLDSAVVMVNASTRFTDGGQFGLGAEIGISTQKLHARGPMGLAELTSTKWIVLGDGQIRR